MLPANLGMRVIGPPRQLGIAVIFFGVCGTCLSAAKNYAAVMGLRVLIGAGEAFVQVGLLYFSFWYKRDEVATRAGMQHLRNPNFAPLVLIFPQLFTIPHRPFLVASAA